MRAKKEKRKQASGLRADVNKDLALTFKGRTD